MSIIDRGLDEIGYLDQLAVKDTPVHRLDPRAKVLVTLVFIICVVSVGPYEISRLLPFFFFPATLIVLGELPFFFLVKKIVLVSPFAVLIGIFNPVLDQDPVLFLGPLAVSGGWLSFFSLLLRFVLTVGAALVLVATTGFPSVCLALEKLKVPRVFTVQLLFLYRYIFVLAEEGGRLARARALRSFNGRGHGLAVFRQMVGHLLLRTLERAQRIHLAMLCRGFAGEIRTMNRLRIKGPEWLFVLVSCTVFIFLRSCNLARLAGQLLLEVLP